MSRAEARADILAAIQHYDECGNDWLDVVTYIGICALFGSWSELCDQFQPWRRRRVG